MKPPNKKCFSTLVCHGLVDSQDAREHSWVGEGTYIMHNVVNDGKQVQLVIGSSDTKAGAGDSWTRTVTAEEIRKMYANWTPHLRQATEELLCQKSEHTALYLWDHLPASTYVSGPLCVVGDAAHAATPWQASGGDTSIEDSLVLSTLLGRAKSSIEAGAALRAYDLRSKHVFVSTFLKSSVS